MFLRIFFGDTDSVSLFSQLPYNNATFEQWFPKFLLQNIQNWANDSEYPVAPRKKVFFGVHHISQQNHLKQKNQNAFVKGDVSRGNSGRIFFSIFQFFVALKSQNTDFGWKNRLICYCKIDNYFKKTKKLPGIPSELCEKVLCKISKRLVQ